MVIYDADGTTVYGFVYCVVTMLIDGGAGSYNINTTTAKQDEVEYGSHIGESKC